MEEQTWVDEVLHGEPLATALVKRQFSHCVAMLMSVGLCSSV
jgi:hypothetical protein